MSDVAAAQQSAEPTARVGTIEEAVQRMQRDRESAAVAASPPEQPESETAGPEASDPGQVDSSDGGVEQVELPEAPVEEEALEEADTKDPEIIRLMIDGEERDLTPEQLSEIVMLKADYTRKTQALAEQRKAVEAKANEIISLEQELAAERQKFLARGQQYDQALQALEKLVSDSDNEFANVDWEAEEAADPIEANRKWRRYQQNRERRAALDAEKARRASEQAELTQAQKIEAGKRLASYWIDRHPEFGDPESGKKGQEHMLRTLVDTGFSQDEIKETFDPRIWELVYDASRWRALQSAKSSATAVTPKARTEAPKPITVVRPGAPRPSSARTARATEVAALAATAKRTGSPQDVFALMQAQQRNAARR